MSTTGTAIRQACLRGSRAVILVPESLYERALTSLAIRFDQYSGRSVRMPSGNLLTVVTPKTPPEEIPGEFDLYLSDWGTATPQEEREILKWISRGRFAYTEFS